MAKGFGDVFAHPVPKTFDRIQVWAIAGQRLEGEIQFSGERLNSLVSVIGGAIPDNHDRTIYLTDPLFQLGEKEKRLVAIALLILPNHASCAAEVIGSIPVDTIGERWAVADTPSTPTHGRPGVAQIHFPVNMGLVHIDEGCA